MTKKIGVAEAKKGFSEIISRIVYKGERFVLERKGKPMAAIVSIKDLERLEEVHGEEIKKGLLAAIGAWQDFETLHRFF